MCEELGSVEDLLKVGRYMQQDKKVENLWGGEEARLRPEAKASYGRNPSKSIDASAR